MAPGFSERFIQAAEGIDGLPDDPRRHARWMREQLEERQGVKVSANAISGWKSGRRIPEEKILAPLAEFLNVSELWLRSGRGDMSLSDSAEVKSPGEPAEAPANKIDDTSGFQEQDQVVQTLISIQMEISEISERQKSLETLLWALLNKTRDMQHEFQEGLSRLSPTQHDRLNEYMDRMRSHRS